MPATPKVKPIPDGMPTLTPHLVCAGAAAAIDFYKRAFDAVEVTRLPGPQGKLMHAMLRIGGSPLMPWTPPLSGACFDRMRSRAAR